MTVASTRATRRSIDTIALKAYKLAGLLEAREGTDSPGWTQRSELARDLLDTMVDHLISMGVDARATEFYDLALTANDYTYSLAEKYVDLIGDGAYIAASESDTSKASSETVVQKISRQEWQRISSKAATGKPSLYYTHRAGGGYQIEVRLWPIPDEAGTVRFMAQVAPADATDGSATLDLREYWMQWVLWELAHQLSVSAGLPEERLSYMSKRANEKLAFARGKSNENVTVQAELAYGSGWRL